MSNMDQALPDTEQKYIEAKVDAVKSKSSTQMLKAMQKRLKLSQKITEAIAAYAVFSDYPAEVEPARCRNLFQELRIEQEKIQAQIGANL